MVVNTEEKYDDDFEEKLKFFQVFILANSKELFQLEQ